MAIGDNTDLLTRLKRVVPSWWPQVTPILDGVLSGFARIGAWGYGLLAYTKLQTRIASMSDGFLDLAALDFFGLRVSRKAAQQDATFRSVIQSEVLRERVTRHGIIKAVQDLTGTPVSMFEPYYPLDTGGWGTNSMGWGEAGAWGSRSIPYQFFLSAVEPIGIGAPNVAGWGTSYGAWGGGYSAWIDQSNISGPVTNTDIYNAVEASRAAGITAWVKIGPPPIKGARLGIDFVLGQSQLARRQ